MERDVEDRADSKEGGVDAGVLGVSERNGNAPAPAKAGPNILKNRVL